MTAKLTLDEVQNRRVIARAITDSINSYYLAFPDVTQITATRAQHGFEVSVTFADQDTGAKESSGRSEA